MNVNKFLRQNSSNKFDVIKEFKDILNELSKDRQNLDLQNAIRSWCIKLSLDQKKFPMSGMAENATDMPRTIVNLVNLWLTENTIIELTVKMLAKLIRVTHSKTSYGFGNFIGQISNNINEENLKENLPIIVEETKNTISNPEPENIINVAKNTQNPIPVKSILIVAFVLTGIGLLLFILSSKSKVNKSQGFNISSTENQHPSSYVKEKYILALLIKSDRYQDLIDSLKNNRFLRSEDSSKLYGATQGLWIGEESEFKKSQIKQKSELVESKSGNTASEYDVHFVTIELDKDDSRFDRDVNPMDRRDAFIDLVKRTPQVTVSRRLSCKAYENTEFYSR